MVLIYARLDKIFNANCEQLQHINIYVYLRNLLLNNQLINKTSQNKRLFQISDVAECFCETIQNNIKTTGENVYGK